MQFVCVVNIIWKYFLSAGQRCRILFTQSAMHTARNMTLSIELAVLIVVSLSCTEACSYYSDCLNGYADTHDFLCCNGQCIDKQLQCQSFLPVLSVAVLTVGVVIICIIACCCCYPFCPCFSRHRRHLARSFIIEGEPQYQQFTSDPTVTDTTEPSCRQFYPQFVSLQHPIQQYSSGYSGYRIHQQAIPNPPYPLLQPKDQGWFVGTDMGQDADSARSATKPFAAWGERPRIKDSRRPTWQAYQINYDWNI